MSAAVLGAHIIEFDGDGRKLLRSMNDLEKSSARTARLVETNIGSAFAKAQEQSTMSVAGMARQHRAQVLRDFAELKNAQKAAVDGQKSAADKAATAWKRQGESATTSAAAVGQIALGWKDVKNGVENFPMATLGGIGLKLGLIAMAAKFAAQAVYDFSNAITKDGDQAWEMMLFDPARKAKKNVQSGIADIYDIGVSYFSGNPIGYDSMDPVKRGSKEPAWRGMNVEKQLNALRLQRASLTDNRAALEQVYTAMDKVTSIELRGAEISEDNIKLILQETKATRDLSTSIEQQAKALGNRSQILELQKQVAEMKGDFGAADDAAASIDEVSQAMMRLQNVPPDVIAKVAALSKEIRGLQTAQREASRWNMKSDLGLQILDIVGSGEERADARAREAHRVRVESYKGDAELIEQSRALLDAQLRQIDIEYGRDWRGLCEQMLLDYDNFDRGLVTAAERTVGAMNDLFGEVFFDAMTGNLHELDDAFKSFFKSIVREIANLLARQATAAILSKAFGFGIATAANGAVWPGGFQAFANGGIVNRPTLGLIGEGDHNEAIVPLPDGKSIPVVMKNGGGTQVAQNLTIGIVGDSSMQAQPDQIITVVMADLRRNGPLRRTIMQTCR